MKKALIPIIVIALVGLFIYTKAVGVYNMFVQNEETVDGNWAEVENTISKKS
jgi:LemA protein